MKRFPSPLPIALIGLLLAAESLHANPYRLQYGGRITESNGQPLQGTTTITAAFYQTATGGSSIASQIFNSLTLTDGIFNVTIELTPAEFHTVFSGSEAWVEITDLTSGKIYPRQRFSAVPYAFKVPVDGTTIGYNINGQLGVQGLAGHALPSGSPADGQILKWRSAGGWEWGSDENGSTPGTINAAAIQDGSIANADISASAAIAGTKVSPNFGSQNIVTTGTISGDGSGLTNLPAGPLGSSVDSSEVTDGSLGDADISATAAIAQSKISGLSASLAAKEPAITAGTSAQYLRGDKTWATLDTSAIPENTNLYYTDARARAAIGVSAPLSYNSTTGVLSLPSATSVANGYLSSGDWLTFSNKQAAITATSALNTGSLSTALQKGLEIKPFDTNAGQTGELRFNELSGANFVGFKAPDAITADKVWILPAADGSNGQFLTTNGSGVLTWSSVAGGSGGTVTSITAGTGLSGGAITGSGTIDLANTAVTAGSYARANITVDAQGRLTAAANGGNVNLTSEVTGTLPVANGGTGAATLTSNGMLFGNGTSAIGATAAGAQYNVLVAGSGGTPAFGQVALGQSAAVSGQLGVAHGGTGLAAGTSGGIPYYSASTTMASSAALTSNGVVLGGGAGSAPTSTGAGSAYQSLRVPSGGGAPAFGALDVSQSAAVTGVLAVANGGTNSSTALNSNRIMVSDTGAIKEAAALTNGQMLIGSTGAAPVAAALAQGANAGVTITNGAGSISLDTAQDIRTSATPTFAGVALGSGSLAAATHVAGSSDASATPVGGTLRAASGAGLNIAGTNLTITSGNGTGTGGSGAINFQTAPVAASSSTANTMATRMTIDKSGNVGIGTTSPAAPLQVEGGIRAGKGDYGVNAGYTFSGDNDTGMFAVGGTAAGGSDIIFRNDSGEIMRLQTATANVGIGTTSPGVILDVLKSGSTAIRALSGSAGSTTDIAIGRTAGEGRIGISSAADQFATGSAAGDVIFRTDATSQRLILNSGSGNATLVVNNGNVGIGTTTPSAPLHVNGYANFGNQTVVNLSANSSNFPLPGTWAATTTYIKIAKVSDVNAAGNGDSVRISGNIGGYGSYDLGKVDIIVTSRSSSSYRISGQVSGNVETGFADIIACHNTDTSTDIYLKLNGFFQLNLNMTATGSASLYPDSTATTTAPTPAAGHSLTSLLRHKSVVWQNWDGNVGIGTTAPDQALEVQASSSNTATLRIRENSSNTATDGGAVLELFGTRSTASVGQYARLKGGRLNSAAHNAGYFSIEVSSNDGMTPVERLRILESGNVGIGTTVPGRKLHVYGSGDQEIGVQSSDTNGRQWTFQSTGTSAITGALQIIDRTAGASRMAIDTSGNVGIGTTVPTGKLHVYGSLCVRASNCASSTNGTIYASNSAISTADLAENMPIEDESLKPGDVVTLETSSSTLKATFAKSTKKNQGNAVGVVSTAPGVLLGSDVEKSRPIALAGRVPVNVNLEGGEIAVGDFLVPSSTPGQAMRAQSSAETGIIGIALSAYEGLPIPAQDYGDGIAHEAGHQVMLLVQNGAGSQGAVATLAAWADQTEQTIAKLNREAAQARTEAAQAKAEAAQTKSDSDELRKFLCTQYPGATICKP